MSIVLLFIGGAVGVWCAFYAVRMGVVEQHGGVLVRNRLSRVSCQ